MNVCGRLGTGAHMSGRTDGRSPFLPLVGPYHYAGLGRRFVALFVDLMLFCSVFFPATRLAKGVWLMTPGDHRWVSGWFITDPLCVAFFVVMAIYYIGLEAKFGATLGKRVARIRVIAPSGDAPGWRKSVIRNGLRVIDSLPAFNLLGVILILRTPERTRVGDLVARTRVILREG
jgi:uncharacterized RDD family membrane protein YckC